MCGIAGIYRFDSGRVSDGKNRVNKMLKIMGHRGPDDSGIWLSSDHSVVLGNNRLAIVNPRKKVKLPYYSETSGDALTFNGEIYNYTDLTEYMKKKHLKLCDGTDTEILFHLLNKGYEYALPKLDGVWAFGFYSSASKELTLARDLLGERHLFYRVTECELIFASEAKAIENDTKSEQHLCADSVAAALRFHSTPPGETLFKNIKRLQAGHVLRVSLSQKPNIKRVAKFQPENYFDFFNSLPPEDKVIEKLFELIHESVSKRIPSDVDFFTTLSGGLDSTLIAYFVSKIKRHPQTIFGNNNADLPELKTELSEKDASSFTSRQLETQHKILQVSDKYATQMLESLAINSGDGLLDWGVVPFQLLAKKIKSLNCKVLLMSDGPDELVGGYQRDLHHHSLDLLRDLHPQMTQNFENISKNSRLARAIFRRIPFTKDLTVEPFNNNSSWDSVPNHQAFGYDYLTQLLPKNLVIKSGGFYGTISEIYSDIVTEMDNTQLRALSYADKSLPDYSNMRLDKALMNESVEPRSPYLNVNLVNYLIAMPSSYRFREGQTKYIFRKAVDRVLGPKISTRAKQGFSVSIWAKPKIMETLKIDETIVNFCPIGFSKYKSFEKRKLFVQNHRKIKWPLFCLSKLNEHHNISSVELREL